MTAKAKKAKEKTKRALYEYKIIKRDELEKKKKNYLKIFPNVSLMML